MNYIFQKLLFQTQHEDIKADFDELKLRHHAVLANKEKMKYEHEENMTRIRDQHQSDKIVLQGKM